MWNVPNDTSRDLNVVNLNVLSRVRQVESMIENGVGLRVLETVQVPVDVRGQHDWRRLGQAEG